MSSITAAVVQGGSVSKEANETTNLESDSICCLKEVVEDVGIIRDFSRLSSELREAVRRRGGYVAELRASRSYDDALGTIDKLSRMHLDDMEKAAHLLLMARETQIKVDEKTGFIMRLRNHVAVLVFVSAC
ncbi:hypothetical protein Tco_1210542 [Tanacetum coccineum]